MVLQLSTNKLCKISYFFLAKLKVNEIFKKGFFEKLKVKSNAFYT